MNAEWSSLCKNANALLKKKDSFEEGKASLLELRKELFDMVMMVYHSFPLEGFSRQVLPNSKGYDSKTMAYSIYHIARIEDIVLHTLMYKEEEIFFSGKYQNKMNSSIVTTGNELTGTNIEEFSKALDIDVLMEYFQKVYEIDNEYIKKLSFEDMKKGFTDEDKKRIEAKGVVSLSEEAYWLIDYWCGKTVLGLLSMPFSRHWICHIEAFLKIKNTIIAKEKKNIKNK